MKRVKKKTRKNIFSLFLVFLLCLTMSSISAIPYYAEDSGYEDSDGGDDSSDDQGDDSEEETEFIPDEYYDPIQSNQISGWPQGEAVQAAGAIVMDLDTNAVLYAKNIEKTYYPASITKIMTALVALENGNLEDVICCGSEVYDLEEDASNLAMQEGEELTLREALYGLMLESANDLANAIAVYIGGSISGFAQMMNDKAASLGCEHTHFVNPNGLHNDDHYTCAKDMALIAQAAYENETFRRIISTTESSIEPTNKTEETRYFANHHKMIQPDSEYYQSWCTGGKTGYTSAAWNTLVTYGEKDGTRLVCVLLHGNGAGRNYLETTDLCNYGFDEFQHKQITDSLHSQEIYDILKADDTAYEPETQISEDDSVTEPTHYLAGGMISLPANAEVSDVKMRRTGQLLSFNYHEWPTGYGTLYTVIPQVKEAVTEAWIPETETETETQSETQTEPVNEIERTAARTLEQFRETASSLIRRGKAFTQENRTMVITVVVLILAVVIFLVVIIIARSTKNYRIRRRRRQEEKERLRREEEIERASAISIEEELRKAMHDERSRQEQEEARERARLIAQEQERQRRQLLEEAAQDHVDEEHQESHHSQGSQD